MTLRLHYDTNVFDDLSTDIMNFCNMNTPLFITGDLNSRTGIEDDFFSDPQIDNSYIETADASISPPARKNCDPVVNAHGRKILNICHTYNLIILNGRSNGDPLGINTYYDTNLGSSTIDYYICSQNIYEHVSYFMVLPQNELSDHCKIVTVFKLIALNNNLDNDNCNWIKLNDKYT